MPLNRSVCKCGRSLSLETEVLAKRCDLCAKGIQLSGVAETVDRLTKVWGKRPGPTRTAKLKVTELASQGNGKVTESLPGNGIEGKVTESGNGKLVEVTETKQERYKRKNADKVKDADRQRKQRRRTGNEA